jgi:outer membrane lipoprotein-sorting protein
MKKFFLLSLLSLFLLSMVTSYVFSSGQSAEAILKKMVEAQGGKQVLEGVKDSTMSGSIFFVPMNANGTITTYWKAPNKRRVDFEILGMQISNVYDGKKAWNINAQSGTQELPEQFAGGLKRQAIGDDLIVNPAKYGVKFTFKGKEKVKDIDCFVLEQTYPDGHKGTLFVDVKTYLTNMFKTKTYNQAGQEVDSESFFSDYKKVNGRMLAHSVVSFQAGQEYVKIKLEKVSYNTGVDDSLFKVEK